MKKAEKEKQIRDKKILEDAKDKKTRYLQFWEPIYKETEKHRRFTLLGEQLSDERKGQLGIQNPMQPNLLLTYANHEANKTLQTDYKGKVTPNGGGANDIKARERQDVLRGLQRTNNINQIFNYVRRDQVAGGIAYSIAVLDYAGKRGFGKTLKDEFLEDYQNVLPDMNVKTSTFEDAKDFLYKREIAISDWEDETGEEPTGWGNDKKKNLWYYWVREDVRDTEYLLQDGKTALGSKLNDDYTTVQHDENEEPLSRPTVDYTWCFYKISDNFDRLYDETEWKGSYCPLVACTGRKVVDSDGKVYYQPLTQFAEEAQEIYTILENIICLRLSMSPFSKWKVALESMNMKLEDTLVQASLTGANTVWYKAFDDQGNAIPPPAEIEPHILDPILITLQQEQERKIQKIFGIFDANLGNKSNEQSGVAIRERAQGGELSNFDLQFNYMEYVEQVTRVKLDLIPKYLTAPQQIAFVDEDDNAVLQWINTTGGVQFSPDEEYSLSIEAMPISQTAREDEAQALMDMAKVLPVMQTNPKVAALIAKAQPGRYSQQIAEILAGEDPQLQEAQKAIQELQGQLQAATAKLQQTTVAAQAKQSQDAMAIASLKQTIGGMKQQQALMKTMHDMEGMTQEARTQMEGVSKDMDEQIRLLEVQVSQYVAESGRITAEAGMLKVVGDLAKPEPATPAPGQGLP